jgi:hypothetical protein
MKGALLVEQERFLSGEGSISSAKSDRVERRRIVFRERLRQTEGAFAEQKAPSLDENRLRPTRSAFARREPPSPNTKRSRSTRTAFAQHEALSLHKKHLRPTKSTFAQREAPSLDKSALAADLMLQCGQAGTDLALPASSRPW